MKILFYDMGSYTSKDIIYYLEQAGHICKTVYYHFADKYCDDFFCHRFADYLNQDHYDLVFSINFFPLVAAVCNDQHIRYVSWSYDSPLDLNLESYFKTGENYIFLFDRAEVERYRSLGYNQVYHLPLAVNVPRLDALQFSTDEIRRYSAEVSFIGHLYESPLETLLYPADSYTKGFIEGILQAQLRIYGYYFIDELLTEEILENVNSAMARISPGITPLNAKGLSFAIASEITHLERTFILEQMGELFDTKFYTTDDVTFTSPVKLCGPAKYFTEMPCIFRHSKLNLNPTLRSIQSGIPLRALDIMGAKGVLLSNYQPELAEYFEDGKDLILYGSLEELFDKTAFYLKNDALLEAIANSGYSKIKEQFRYSQRIEEMFKICM